MRWRSFQGLHLGRHVHLQPSYDARYMELHLRDGLGHVNPATGSSPMFQLHIDVTPLENPVRTPTYGVHLGRLSST